MSGHGGSRNRLPYQYNNQIKPIEYISDGVIKVAEFLPVYWYIKANRCISEMFESGIGSNMGELMECIGIQLLFFLAIVSVGMVIRKRYTRQVTG